MRSTDVIRLLEDLVSGEEDRYERAKAALPEAVRSYSCLSPLLIWFIVKDRDAGSHEETDSNEEDMSLPWLNDTDLLHMGEGLRNKAVWLLIRKLFAQHEVADQSFPSHDGQFRFTIHPYEDITVRWKLLLYLRSSAQFLKDLRSDSGTTSSPLARLETFHIEQMLSSVQEAWRNGQATWDDIVRFAYWCGRSHGNDVYRLIHSFADEMPLHLFIPLAYLPVLYTLHPQTWAFYAGVRGVTMVPAMNAFSLQQYEEGQSMMVVMTHLQEGLSGYVDWMVGLIPSLEHYLPTVAQCKEEISRHAGTSHAAVIEEYLMGHHEHDPIEQPNYAIVCSWCNQQV